MKYVLFYKNINGTPSTELFDTLKEFEERTASFFKEEGEKTEITPDIRIDGQGYIYKGEVRYGRAKLKDVLPIEFFNEYLDSPVTKHMECYIVAQREDTWFGIHKNVNIWWELDNGIGIGWNENPSRGWSFISKKIPTNMLSKK